MDCTWKDVDPIQRDAEHGPASSIETQGADRFAPYLGVASNGTKLSCRFADDDRELAFPCRRRGREG